MLSAFAIRVAALPFSAVFVNRGATYVTAMPEPISSRRKASEKPRSANLLAEYEAKQGKRSTRRSTPR